MTTAATISDLLTTARDLELGAYLVALDASGERAKLEGKGPFTVFIPTDAAYEYFSSRQLRALQDDPESLRRLIRYSIVRGALPKDALVKLDAVETIGGERLEIDSAHGIVQINGATVADEIEATNGVVYVVDEVPVPPSMRARFGRPESVREKEDEETFAEVFEEETEEYERRLEDESRDDADDKRSDGAKSAKKTAKKRVDDEEETETDVEYFDEYSSGEEVDEKSRKNQTARKTATDEETELENADEYLDDEEAEEEFEKKATERASGDKSSSEKTKTASRSASKTRADADDDEEEDEEEDETEEEEYEELDEEIDDEDDSDTKNAPRAQKSGSRAKK